MKVIKRDGTSVDYDRSKIVTAIEKANAEVAEEDRLSRTDIDAIIDGIEALKRPRILVEDIQDLGEQGLVLSPGGDYHGEGWFRMNVACPRAQVEQALQALKAAME